MTSPLPPEIANPIVAFWQTYKWIIVIVVACIAVGYLSVLILGKNNPIELEVEKVIEAETGLHLNLTP
jgi:hypothetical protein